jgi:predicted secreted Zn-dependent protease
MALPYMRTLSLTAVTIFFSIILRAQSISGNGEDFIEWNSYYQLQWNDFQGAPGADAIGDAGTAVQIKASPYLVKKKVHYEVRALFNKKKSWKRETSDAVLTHERLHFDIAELYARLIRKKISELRNENINDIKVYNAAIEAILEESNDADTRYDLETLHGAIQKKQLLWEQKIKSQLLSVDNFRKQKHVITAG